VLILKIAVLRPHGRGVSRPFPYIALVIAGFNTDIEFAGTVFHVQTEDKGAPANMIMSLVYDKGTILASKRVSYADLAAVGMSEKELTERVSRQHKLMCAAVKAGRMDELKEMTAKSAAAGARSKAVDVAVTPKAPEPISLPSEPLPPPTPPAAPVSSPQLRIGSVETEKVIRVIPNDTQIEETVIEAVHIIEDDEILPAEAVAVVSELSGQERASNEKLSLELLGDPKFKGGDRTTVNLMICRGTARKVVTDAQIMVKVLGSAFRPVIFHAKTDQNGLARVHLQLPHFQAGRAALLVRAMSAGEEIELRRLVKPG